MNIAFYSASTGVIHQLEGLNVLANNVANVNTTGFKASRPSFSDCLYTTKKATEPDWQTGHGGFLHKTDLLYTQGGFTFSESPLDFALPNDGLFALDDGYGNISYTRDGSFHMSQIDGGDWQLVTSSGDFVLDYEGNRITMPFTEEGAVDEVALADLVGVYSFDNPYGLDQLGGNKFEATLSSGEAEPRPDLDKVQFALELSSVDYATEVVRIIETQRAFQMNTKMVQTADEMRKTINTLR